MTTQLTTAALSVGDCIAFDIMLDVVYGSKSDMVGKPDNRPLLDAIAKSNIRVGVMMPLYYLKNSIFDRYLFPSSIIARYTFIAFIKSLLQSKKDGQGSLSARRSVYSILAGSSDSESLGPNEIAAESTNLIVAGESSKHSHKFKINQSLPIILKALLIVGFQNQALTPHPPCSRPSSFT